MSEFIDLNRTMRRVIEVCPELVFLGNTTLRTATVSANIPEAIKISDQLQRALRVIREITGYGRGLAAPQIGINKSVFVTYTDNFKTYINPVILERSEDCNYYKEGCLSSGGLWADIKRPASIKIKYTDTEGNEVTESADGMLARLLQHEVDHLDGILNIDIAEPGTIEYMLSDPLEEKIRDC